MTIALKWSGIVARWVAWMIWVHCPLEDVEDENSVTGGETVWQARRGLFKCLYHHHKTLHQSQISIQGSALNKRSLRTAAQRRPVPGGRFPGQIASRTLLPHAVRRASATPAMTPARQQQTASSPSPLFISLSFLLISCRSTPRALLTHSLPSTSLVFDHQPSTPAAPFPRPEQDAIPNTSPLPPDSPACAAIRAAKPLRRRNLPRQLRLRPSLPSPQFRQIPTDLRAVHIMGPNVRLRPLR